LKLIHKFYQIILTNPKQAISFFINTDYQKIPKNSLNFKVFLVSLYYKLNKVISLSDIMRDEFSDFIDFLKIIATDDYEQRIINVILERLNNDY